MGEWYMRVVQVNPHEDERPCQWESPRRKVSRGYLEFLMRLGPGDRTRGPGPGGPARAVV